MSGFLRHVEACDNAPLPGDRVRLRVAGVAVGYVEPACADRLVGMAGLHWAADGGLSLDNPAALPAVGRAVAAAGLGPWRGEAFAVRATLNAEPLGTIDRGALPVLGLIAEGVHLNGLVERPDGLYLWVSRRANDRPLDPGKLDHLAAGGIAAGQTPQAAMRREAAEEAGLSDQLLAGLRLVGRIGYSCARPEGLRRDRLHCFDLMLPNAFTPCSMDGELASFALWPLAQVAERIAMTDDFKFNVNLVILNLLLRRGIVSGTQAARLQERMKAARERIEGEV